MVETAGSREICGNVSNFLLPTGECEVLVNGRNDLVDYDVDVEKGCCSKAAISGGREVVEADVWWRKSAGKLADGGEEGEMV